jgi:PPOX class probable F420-dependent enzyme
MALEISAAIEDRLKNELIVWLTTVRADGTPQPTPVWFLWQDQAFFIFSQPNAQKLRNLKHNPKVALNLNSDEWGGQILVIIGEAAIEPKPLSEIQRAAYVEKYREAIKDIDMTPDSLARDFSILIRVIPTRIRGE